MDLRGRGRHEKEGSSEQDAGDREGWRRRVVKGLANPR